MSDDEQANKGKRPGLVEDLRGGLREDTAKMPARGGIVGDGPDTLRDGSPFQKQEQARPGPPPLPAEKPAKPAVAGSPLRQLLLDPNEIAATNVALGKGRHRRTMELLELDLRREDLRRGVLETAAIHQALKVALDLVAQLQQANKAHLKHEHLKRNAAAFATWLDELRRIQDRLHKDPADGESAFRAFVLEEERKADENEADDAVRTIAKVGMTGEVWQGLVQSFEGRVSRDRLLGLTRGHLGDAWQPPAGRAEVDALLQYVKWVSEDKSFLVFSAEPPPVLERDLLQRKVPDVHERSMHLAKRFAAAEKGSAELRTALQDAKVATWLSIIGLAAKATAEDAAVRVAKMLWLERARRFRRDMMVHVTKKYTDDGQIDFAEWVSLKDRAEEAISDDKAGAQDALVALVREVTKNPNWAPPLNPRHEVDRERKRRAEAEARAAELATRFVIPDGGKGQSVAPAPAPNAVQAVHAAHAVEAVKRHFEQRLEEKDRAHARERAEQEQRFEADRASQIVGTTVRRPRIVVGALLGAIAGVVLALLAGLMSGRTFSSESRMALAAKRTPLAAKQSPDSLRIVCAPPAERELRRADNARTIAKAAGSVHPPNAAELASARGTLDCAPTESAK